MDKWHIAALLIAIVAIVAVSLKFAHGRRIGRACLSNLGTSARHALPKRILLGLVLAAVLLALPLGIIEMAYRFQWVDTYRAELRAYNSPDTLAGARNGPTLLALGDSFTAGTAAYPDALASILPGWRIVNGGISGTGIIQANIVAPRRLRTFKPTVCVYQLFVGNDLFDIRYPTRGAHLSPARRLYWFLATRARSLAFINYRLGQWRGVGPATYVPFHPSCVPPQTFDPDRYDPRERLYLTAEPTLLEDQALVTPRRAADYGRLLRGLTRLRDLCRQSGSSLVLLAIPHAAQAAPVYRQRMQELGATFSDPERMAEPEYPFLAGIRLAFAGDPDVVVVNPLPALQASERRGIPVYFVNDGHLNRAGQECVARELASSIAPFLEQSKDWSQTNACATLRLTRGG